MPNENNSLDVLGVKPIADAINTVTKGTVEGASAFLSRICMPAAEEFGLLLKDHVSAWRAKNAINISKKAQDLVEKQVGGLIVMAHPRIVFNTIEHGSWADEDFMQNLWAGLLASSCTSDGTDESNLIFINMLSQLTRSQARLINYISETAKIYKSVGGWIGADEMILEPDELIRITGINDLQQLDRELDHLRALGLFNGGFIPEATLAAITPLSLCLQLYVRTQGFVGSPIDYFGDRVRIVTSKPEQPIKD